MLDYFFEAFPPYDSEGAENPNNIKAYEPSKPEDPATSLVMLATLSGDAEVIDYVLDRSTIEEVEHAYRYAQTQIRHARSYRPTITAWKAVQRMLEQKESFSPPLEFMTRLSNGPRRYPGGGKTWYKGYTQARPPRNSKETKAATQSTIGTGKSHEVISSFQFGL